MAGSVALVHAGENPGLTGLWDVSGDGGSESITVNDGSNVTFHSGFNAGAVDNVRLTGNASDFKISSNSISNAVLTSTVDNITVNIPIGANGINITFDNGDVRNIAFVGANMIVSGTNLAPYTVTTTPTNLAAGPAVFSITGAATAPEGSDYTFVAHRTTDGVNAAASYTFNVLGDTNGGTVPAATPGADFNTAAGNTVTFAAGSLVSAPFVVHLNTDNLVEGLEGIKVQLFNGATVLATTTGLIADANHVGQTFTLTGGIDTVGSGTALDLVGSEGSTSVVGQDTIIATENTINTFDNVNGGPDNDTFTVLDAGTFFTTAPNFTLMTVTNVENFNYTSVRGLFGNTINTSAWTGLQHETLNINSGLTQTVIAASTGMLSEVVNNGGAGGINIQGGGNTLGGPSTLSVSVNGGGTINVGQDGSENGFTSISTNGGGTVNITDTVNPVTHVGQELTNVSLSGFSGNANVTSTVLATALVTNITAGGTHTATFNGSSNPTVTVSNSSGGTLNLVTNFGPGQFIIAGGVTDLGDVTALDGGSSSLTFTGGTGTLFFDDFNTDDNSTGNGSPNGTITNSSSNGNAIVFDDFNGDSVSNDTRSLTLNATNGSITLDDIFGSTFGGFQTSPFVLNINGNNAVTFDTVTESTVGGTNITRLGSGNTTTGLLGNLTQFNGSGDTGADNVTFGSNTRTNTLGGGNDTANFNAALMGTVAGVVTGSIDGGAGTDTFVISEANGQSLTAQGNFVTNFEKAILTGGSAAGVTDTVNVTNLGFTIAPGGGVATTNIVVTGDNSAISTPEVTKVTFSGTSTGMTQGSAATISTGDKVTFDGFTIQFDDNATGATLGAEFKARYDAAVGTHHYSVVDNGDGSVSITNLVGGTAADLTAASFPITDVTNIGAPSIGNGVNGPNVTTTTQGVTQVNAVTEIAQLTLNNASVATTETITVTNGTNTFTYTNTSGGTLLGSNGSGANPPVNNSLANDFVTKFNTAGNALSVAGGGVYTASASNGNIVFTANAGGAQPDLTLNQPGTTGLTTPADDYSMLAPGTNGVGQQGVTFVPGVAEKFDATVVNAGNARDTILFDGTTITLNGTENTNELVAAAIAAGVYADWTVTVDAVNNALLHFTAKNTGSVADQTAGSFTIFDDTNVAGAPQVLGGPNVAGPSVAVAVTTQGDVGGLVLNNVTNNASLELDGNGIYTVNLTTQTAADKLSLFLANHTTDIVNAPGVETVALDVGTYIVPGTDTLTLNDTSLATLTVVGNDALVLTAASTALTTLDASALGGFLTWTSAALAGVITVSTGSGGSNINMLADTKTVIFNGGAGNDTLVLGNANSTTVNLGGGNDTVTTGTGLTNSITLGTGHDLVNVTQTLNGNSYSKVADYAALSVSAVGGNGDTVHFGVGADGILGAFNAAQVATLQPTASFQDYLDAAMAGHGSGTIRWFQFTSGVGANNNTYLVDDNSGAATFQNGIDNVIELTGLHDGTVAALGNLALATSAGNTGSVFVA